MCGSHANPPRSSVPDGEEAFPKSEAQGRKGIFQAARTPGPGRDMGLGRHCGAIDGAKHRGAGPPLWGAQALVPPAQTVGSPSDFTLEAAPPGSPWPLRTPWLEGTRLEARRSVSRLWSCRGGDWP